MNNFKLRRINVLLYELIGGLEIMLFTSMFVYLNLILTITVAVLGIYALILLIKALKIYIKKNS